MRAEPVDRRARPTPAALAEAAQNGDAGAFTTLVERFQDMAVGTAFARLGDMESARDAAQESFTEAYLHLAQLREPAAFPGWLRRIVHKHCDRVTRRRTVATASLGHVAEAPSSRATPPEALEAEEGVTRLRRAIESLPEAQRSVVALYYLAGDSQDEIAGFLGIPTGTVRKRLHDARRHLRERSFAMPTDVPLPRPSRDRRFSDEVQLFLAVRGGDLDAARSLLDVSPALVDIEEDYDTRQAISHGLPIPQRSTPLIRAAECGDVAMIDLLLDRGACIDRLCPCEGRESALWAALVNHRSPAVARLLARGADPNAAAFFGKTPLHVAAMRGFDDMAAMLLANGADETRLCAAGRTPADWARANGHLDLAAQLGAGTAEASAASVAGSRTSASPTTAPPTPAQGTAAPQRALADDASPVQTGIKALDLFAPFAPGARLRMHGGVGLGQLVLLSEWVRSTAKGAGTCWIWAGWGRGPWEPRSLDAGLAEMGIDGFVHPVLEPVGAPESRRHELAERAMEAAENQRRGGARHVVLVYLAEQGFSADIDAILPRAGRGEDGAISVVVVDPLDAEPRPEAPAWSPGYDGRITLDPALARVGLFPAIHPLWSETAVLTPEHVGEQHCAIAAGARALLQRLRELDPKLTRRPADEVPSVDRDTLERARQLQAFLTQPFHTTEPFLHRGGVDVPLPRTLENVGRILEGELAGVDVARFTMRGTLDEVLEAAASNAPKVETTELFGRRAED